MHDGVEEGEEEDGDSEHLVDVDVVVEGEDLAGLEVPQLGHGVAQHHHDHQHGVEQQAATFIRSLWLFIALPYLCYIICHKPF